MNILWIILLVYLYWTSSASSDCVRAAVPDGFRGRSGRAAPFRALPGAVAASLARESRPPVAGEKRAYREPWINPVPSRVRHHYKRTS